MIHKRSIDWSIITIIFMMQPKKIIHTNIACIYTHFYITLTCATQPPHTSPHTHLLHTHTHPHTQSIPQTRTLTYPESTCIMFTSIYHMPHKQEMQLNMKEFKKINWNSHCIRFIISKTRKKNKHA